MATLPARILLAFASAATGLLLAEGISRALPLEEWDGHVFDTPEGHAVTQYRLTPGRGYEAIPHASAEINNLGMRGPDRTEAKPAGCYRVLVLGDSVAFGLGVGPDETFSTLLEQDLAKAYPDRPIEVLNTGTSGYNTAQELSLLQERGLALEPDLVVLAYCPNDVMVTPIVFEQDGRYVFYQPNAKEPGLYNATLIRSSSFYRLVMYAYETWKARAEGTLRRNAGINGRTTYDTAGSLDALTGLAELTKAHGIPLVCIIFPYLDRPFADYDPRIKTIHEQATRRLQVNEVPVIDLLQRWSKRDYLDFKRSDVPDFVHPNARGHLDAAKQLLRFIQERKLID